MRVDKHCISQVMCHLELANSNAVGRTGYFQLRCTGVDVPNWVLADRGGPTNVGAAEVSMCWLAPCLLP